jgi:tetratricopeptide (TPR) repeat protein
MIRQFDKPSKKKSRESGPRSLLRRIERAMASKSTDLSAQAQNLFYEAMEAPTDEKELELLEKALKLDAGNVDVLLALLRRQRSSDAETIECLHKLVKHAATRLGPKVFKECAGAFWGFHETRPYMRARQQLAEHLRVAGRLEDAVTEYEGMLELNPSDNQGVRYSLLPCLLILQRMDAARKLFEKYPDEFQFNAVFAWGHVLERFLSNDLPGAEAALAIALKQNPHVQAYVKGHRQIPTSLPEAYSPGSKEEAICFADGLRAAWRKHPTALKWLEAPEGIVIKPVTAKFIRGLRGSLKGKGVLKAMMEDRKSEREP